MPHFGCISACAVCIPWWGGASPGCREGRRLAYQMRKINDEVDRLTHEEIAQGVPIPWVHQTPKAGIGVQDGTKPKGSPGYWAEGYPKV